MKSKLAISGLVWAVVCVGLLLVGTTNSEASHNEWQRFRDNGDGTVLDRLTGLMWEQKNNTNGGGPDSDNPNDVDNTYPWTSTDGTDVFNDFLARLNGVVASTAMSEQLGGYSDWRIPTSTELHHVAGLAALLSLQALILLLSSLNVGGFGVSNSRLNRSAFGHIRSTSQTADPPPCYSAPGDRA